MKSFIFLIFCFFISGSLNALADDAATPTSEEVTTSSLKLLGKGIENRKTHEVISFACISENCDQMRSVYFNSNKDKAYFFGEAIHISQDGTAPTQKQIKKQFKFISKNFRQFQNDSETYEHKNHRLLGIVAGIGLLWYTVPTAAALFGGIGLFVGGGIYIVFNAPILSFNGTVTNSLNDQNGWNWTVNPKKVSSRHFESLIQILNGSSLKEIRNQVQSEVDSQSHEDNQSV